MNKISIVALIVAVTACGSAASAAPPKTRSVASATPLAATGSGATGQPPAAMGVEAKRQMKHFQDEVLPRELARFKASCGYEVAVDVDWESFGNDAERIRGLSSNRGFGSELNEGFHHVCKDQIGKDGVQKQIKRISIKNIADKANKKMVLEAGVFRLELALDIKLLIEGTFPSGAYRSYLEKTL